MKPTKKKHTPTTTRTYNGDFKFANRSNSTYKKNIGYYQLAFNTLKNMLEGKTTMDLKKAIFLVENIVNRDAISYQTYLKKIEDVKKYVHNVAQQEGLDLNKELHKHFAIQRLFSDTTNQVYHYDLYDFMGRKDGRNLLLTKLLLTGSGQCRSMPLAYLVLAQELEATAYLAFSPSHSYIMFQHKGQFYNYETTNGCITSNQWVLGSGYIKVEAIQSKIYMQPLGKKTVLAQLMVDIATMYREQNGYDEFLNEIINTSLSYYYGIHGVMEKSNVETAYMDYAFWRNGYLPLEKALQNPKLNQQYANLMKRYDEIDNLGYSAMPEQAYQAWLASIEKEKEKRASKAIELQLKKLD